MEGRAPALDPEKMAWVEQVFSQLLEKEGMSMEDLVEVGPGNFRPLAEAIDPQKNTLGSMGSINRSYVHPQERIAPHWSRARFVAHGMPEVSCEARHATFGPLKEVQGRLVRCNPPMANEEITNEHEVRDNIAYIKRGGCSFTKKARMAQKAGAIGMVVANSDEETFGMSYTDDGEPFESISIPCVMITSDVCSRLEACEQSPDGKAPWTCTVTPLVERQDAKEETAVSGAAATESAVVSSPPDQRCGNASAVMGELKESLTNLHKKVGGKTDKIEAFFADLAPEPQTGKPMPEGMINTVLGIDSGATECELEDFLSCFERNLGLEDTVDKIKPVVDKHISA